MFPFFFRYHHSSSHTPLFFTYISLDVDSLLDISTSAGLDASPVEKALKKGGVQAIAPCEDCEPSADGLSAVDESGNQVKNEKH